MRALQGIGVVLNAQTEIQIMNGVYWTSIFLIKRERSFFIVKISHWLLCSAARDLAKKAERTLTKGSLEIVIE